MVYLESDDDIDFENEELHFCDRLECELCGGHRQLCRGRLKTNQWSLSFSKEKLEEKVLQMLSFSPLTDMFQRLTPPTFSHSPLISFNKSALIALQKSQTNKDR